MDKIKINLSARLVDELKRDAEVFGFIKKDGSVNFNDFLNTLIDNYADSPVRKPNTKSILEKTLKENGIELSNDTLNSIAMKINLKYIDPLIFHHSMNECSISYKPSRVIRSEAAKNFLYNSENTSGSIRRLFENYIELPRTTRETIIFKSAYVSVNEAIKNKKYIHIRHKSREIGKVLPYRFVSGREEMNNYLLCEKADGTVDSFRLSHILSVGTTDETGDFLESSKQLFKEAKIKGPQFITTHKKEIVVELTPKGIELFKSAYVHRPVPVKIQKNLYYFDWDENQILFYFKRFGKEAKVISPKECIEEMKQFYKEALERYE